MMPSIYTAEDALFLSPDLLGGKAANLAWMTREGFPVPRWWVVTTAAFKQLLSENGLSDWIEQSLTGFNHSEDLTALEPIAAAIREKILAATIPQPLTQELKQSFGQLENVYFAVRSSVLGEDAQGASFAGQMDSYLFQRGLTAIEESLLQVCASAFNTRALQYRLTKGIALTDIRAAVIIQEMIEGEVSGVMFTANPLTGNRKQCLISAAWGVGEGIVAGICNTDEYTIGLYDSQFEQKLADKDLAVVFNHEQGRGTLEIHVEDNKRHIACLTHNQIKQLRDIGKAIAEHRRFPQDIEWAYRQGQFYILQTRPVTHLPAPTQPTDRRVVFDNSNIQESYCGVTTPLTFSFANNAYRTVYEQTMRVMGAPEKQIQDHRDMLANLLGLVHGRIYYNINNWYRGLLLLPAFKTNKADMERMMGLTDPVDLVQDTQLTTGQKLRKLPQVLLALWRLLRGFKKMPFLVQQFRQMFDNVYHNIPRKELHTFTTGELVEKAHYLDRELLQKWTTPIINDFYVMMMNGNVHRTLVAAGFEQPAVLQNNLLSGEEGIESTEPTKMLLRMCSYIRQQPHLRQVIEAGDNKNLLERVQVHDANFYQQCQEYIEKYGDRTIGELKLESITLRQDASFLFAILKNYLSRDDLTLETLSANEARFRQEAEQQAFTAIAEKLGQRRLRQFKTHLTKLRDAIRNRENMRLARTRMFALYRDVFLQIGEQFASDGLLENGRDIFYLSLEEIYAWYDGRAVQTNIKGLTQLRKAEYQSYEQQDLPHHFWTYGVVYHHNSYQYPYQENIQLDGDLQGTGCYPGVVENKIRLIFSPDDELSLNGQILCTVRTDPGWAPLFPTAGGILVERGSTLSHSAVVARELGIPAIVGIPNITKILHDGELVKMDGALGTIIRLEEQNHG